MAKAKQAFTYTKWVKVDKDGNTTNVAEPYKKDGELKDGVHPEHVNVKSGDEVSTSEIPEEDRGGIQGFLED